jgi:hypothetical protein
MAIRPIADGITITIAGSVLVPTPTSTGAVVDAVAELVNIINGLGLLFKPSFHPVRLGQSFTVRHPDRTTSLAATSEGGSVRVMAGPGTLNEFGCPSEEDSQELAARPLFVSQNSQAASDALHILARRSLTWSELYVLYELARCAAKGLVVSPDDSTKRDIKRFTHTANNYTALGIDGRHGPTNHQPPADPMQHFDAVILVRRMVLSWLRAESPAAKAP